MRVRLNKVQRREMNLQLLHIQRALAEASLLMPEEEFFESEQCRWLRARHESISRELLQDGEIWAGHFLSILMLEPRHETAA